MVQLNQFVSMLYHRNVCVNPLKWLPLTSLLNRVRCEWCASKDKIYTTITASEPDSVFFFVDDAESPAAFSLIWNEIGKVGTFIVSIHLFLAVNRTPAYFQSRTKNKRSYRELVATKLFPNTPIEIGMFGLLCAKVETLIAFHHRQIQTFLAESLYWDWDWIIASSSLKSIRML